MTDLLPIVVVGLVLLAALAGVGFWLRNALQSLAPRPEDQQAIAELKGQVSAITQQNSQQMEALRSHVLQLQGQITQSIETSRQAIDARLNDAARVISSVNQNLGQLGEKTQRLAEIGKDIAGLQDLLRAPKFRGSMSELHLGDLLAQILPSDHFSLQHPFKGGEIVDAVISLRAGLVPVDAKFPLENFKRLLAATSDDERKAARKVFVRDVKTHIDAIAKKYIRPDEGTFDFALMYIFAENVYYETIVRDDELGDAALFEYAMARRVIPVSPNSFYAYLQTILLGLKGMRIEESAREVIDQLSRLHAEFVRFSEAFRLVGQHMDNARAKYDEAQKRLDKVEGKLTQIDGVVSGSSQPALPAGD